MKRLSIILLVILCTGCGFHRFPHRFSLYKDYQRIKVGFPVPTDIQKNAKWGGENDPNVIHIHEFFRESAVYQLANDGNVVSKWYEGASAGGSFLVPLWVLRQSWSEGELLLNLDPAVAYEDSDIRKEIEKKYIDNRGKYADTDDLKRLLKMAMDKGGLANENFHLRKFEIDKFFPTLLSSTWQISRTSSGSYYLSLERRQFVTYLASWFD